MTDASGDDLALHGQSGYQNLFHSVATFKRKTQSALIVFGALLDQIFLFIVAFDHSCSAAPVDARVCRPHPGRFVRCIYCCVSLTGARPVSCLVLSNQFCLYDEVSKEKVCPLEQFAEENDVRQRAAISFEVTLFKL